MIYPYLCGTCSHAFDVIKRVAEMDKPELCEKCQAPSTRQFTASVHIVGARVTHAEYNPAFGMVINNKRHQDYEAKKRGMTEVGNDFATTDSLHTKFDTEREEKREARYAKAIEEGI